MTKENAKERNTVVYDEREREIFALEEEIIRLFHEGGEKELLVALDERLVALKGLY